MKVWLIEKKTNKILIPISFYLLEEDRNQIKLGGKLDAITKADENGIETLSSTGNVLTFNKNDYDIYDLE